MCSQCGRHAAPEEKFCPECGGKIVEKFRVCSKCGKRAEDAEKFCTECGGEIVEKVEEIKN